MTRKQPTAIHLFGLALIFAAFSFTACNNSGEKKEDAAKTDTPAKVSEPAPAPTTAPSVPDSTKGGGDTLKQKPTAPGD